MRVYAQSPQFGMFGLFKKKQPPQITEQDKQQLRFWYHSGDYPALTSLQTEEELINAYARYKSGDKYPKQKWTPKEYMGVSNSFKELGGLFDELADKLSETND
jgi:hypothetical protein